MILSAYVARRFLRMLLLISAIFAAILFLIDIVEQIRRFSGEEIGLTGAAGLSALNITGGFYAIFPLVTVLAGISLFLGLSRSSELVAIRASGRSGLRVLAAPAVTAALVGMLAVAIMNPVVAATSRLYDEAVANIRSNGGQAISVGDSAVWLRQALPMRDVDGSTTQGQAVIRAARTSLDATTLYDATFIVFEQDTGPTRRIEARQATLGNRVWVLSDVKEWPLTAANPETLARSAAIVQLPTELTADSIRDSFGRPEAIPIWHLPAFIGGLERAGFSAARHKVWFQMELAQPLLLAAMIAIAAAFAMRHMRGRNTGMLVLGAFGCGIALFFLRNLAQVLGDNGDIPAWLAGWAPPIVALFFALGALLRLEDG